MPCAEGQLASCELCDKCGEGGLCKGPNYDDCTKCGDEDFYLDASGGLLVPALALTMILLMRFELPSAF